MPHSLYFRRGRTGSIYPGTVVRPNPIAGIQPKCYQFASTTLNPCFQFASIIPASYRQASWLRYHGHHSRGLSCCQKGPGKPRLESPVPKRRCLPAHGIQSIDTFSVSAFILPGASVLNGCVLFIKACQLIVSLCGSTKAMLAGICQTRSPLSSMNYNRPVRCSRSTAPGGPAAFSLLQSVTCCNNISIGNYCSRLKGANLCSTRNPNIAP